MARARKWDWTAILLMSPSFAIFLALLVLPIVVVLVLSFGERAEAGGHAVDRLVGRRECGHTGDHDERGGRLTAEDGRGGA